MAKCGDAAVSADEFTDFQVRSTVIGSITARRYHFTETYGSPRAAIRVSTGS